MAQYEKKSYPDQSKPKKKLNETSQTGQTKESTQFEIQVDCKQIRRQSDLSNQDDQNPNEDPFKAAKDKYFDKDPHQYVQSKIIRRTPQSLDDQQDNKQPNQDDQNPNEDPFKAAKDKYFDKDLHQYVKSKIIRLRSQSLDDQQDNKQPNQDQSDTFQANEKLLIEEKLLSQAIDHNQTSAENHNQGQTSDFQPET